MRVSFVPPDFEMTTVSVLAMPPAAPIRSSSRAMPSGSVLSKKKRRIRSSARPEGVGDELRAERRAADADQEEVPEVAGRSGAIFPAWTSAANAFTRVTVSSMARASAGSGASSGARSQ